MAKELRILLLLFTCSELYSSVFPKRDHHYELEANDGNSSETEKENFQDFENVEFLESTNKKPRNGKIVNIHQELRRKKSKLKSKQDEGEKSTRNFIQMVATLFKENPTTRFVKARFDNVNRWFDLGRVNSRKRTRDVKDTNSIKEFFRKGLDNFVGICRKVKNGILGLFRRGSRKHGGGSNSNGKNGDVSLATVLGNDVKDKDKEDKSHYPVLIGRETSLRN